MRPVVLVPWDITGYKRTIFFCFTWEFQALLRGAYHALPAAGFWSLLARFFGT
jgi:hypothetical protein